MVRHAILNGKIVPEESICISPNNRSFRYGDGFFETMRMSRGKIKLFDLHLDRIDHSMHRLFFTTPDELHHSTFLQLITNLAQLNGHDVCGRIRITFYRSDGGLYDNVSSKANYLVQTWDADAITALNKKGLTLGFYEDARKVNDAFSNIKSNNFLAYAMGALWANKQQLDDCLLLNPYDKIADATIANVFITKNGIIATPPLSDGPVSGVMRKFILQHGQSLGLSFTETSLTKEDVLNADEVFLTNAVFGIKWVAKLDSKTYGCNVSSLLYQKIVAPLFQS